MTTVIDDMDTGALAFGDDVLDTEARLLSAGWRSPVRLWNAAVEFGLCGDSFADSSHAAVFWVLILQR